MCPACQAVDQLLTDRSPCGHTGDARVLVGNPDWNAGKPRQVMFYRATRPQAPKYAKLPENAGKVECSVCRGTFVEDTKEAKAAHRQAHREGHWTVVCRVCNEDVCNHPDCQARHVTHDCAVYRLSHTC